MDSPTDWSPDTLAVRGGLLRSNFEETAEAIYPTSGFVYQRAEDAEAAFNEEIERYTYSRYSNPTVSMLEERLRQMHGAQACQATASGMAAVFGALGGICEQGDRIVASKALFGSCYVIVDEVLRRWGVDSTFVDGKDLDAWQEALDTPARAVFFETPSNPTQELVDIAGVCEIAHAAGALVVVDNVFGTPVFSKPFAYGADLVVYSTTKHIDGQGRVLGGAILGSTELVTGPIRTLLRNTGPAMSPFNAWVTVKGLETLRLRVEHQAASTLTLARHLEADPRVSRVFHPFLESHPQHELAKRQMSGGGTVVTFTVDGGQTEAFALMNALQIVDISNNLGDSKSLVTHPGTTTHRKLPEESRLEQGMTDGTIRMSVGLEDVEDLRADLDQALAVAFG